MRRYSDDTTALVGAAAVALLVGIIALSYGGKAVSNASGYPVKAVFGRIDGLSPNAEVRLGGVQVGRVVKQTLDKNYRAVVTMTINNGVALPKDSAAAIHTDGLFGSKYIELEPGGEETVLQANDHIAMTQNALVVEELLDLIIRQGHENREQLKKIEQD